MIDFSAAGDLERTIILAVEVLAMMVTLATLITALVPSRWDNDLADRIFSLLNLIAGNVGHIKNADEE
ncbi:hypothetical protein [Sneathiella sp.]|uniref:hypothetical protein n=1 Tax=Sneathiella sp. TaxID=1964365 RepID=UPI003568A4E7